MSKNNIMILTEGNISNISKNKIIFVMQLSQSNTAVINTGGMAQ